MPDMTSTVLAAPRALLHAAAADAASGRGRLIVLAGAPGSGKSTLVAELAEYAAETGMIAVSGRCDPDPVHPSFWLWTQVLRGLLAAEPPGVPSVRWRLQCAAALAEPDDSDEEPCGTRALLFDQVIALIAGIAGHRPALICLEDLQWADESARVLLHHLARGVAGLPVLLVATWQDEPGPLPPAAELLPLPRPAEPVWTPPTGDRALLHTAAVLGERADTDLFGHQEIRAAVYGAIPAAERAELHLRAATMLEDLARDGGRVHPAELAHHLRHAGPEHAARAATQARHAGDRALAALAYEDAATHYRRALAGLGEDPLGEALIRLSLGEAEQATAAPSARSSLLAAAGCARIARRPDLLARAALSLCAGPVAVERPPVDAEQIALLTEAAEALADRDRSLRVLITARLATAHADLGELERARRLSDTARQLATQTDDPVAHAAALIARAEVLSGPAHVRERLRMGVAITRLGGQAGDPHIQLTGLRLRVVTQLEVGEHDGVEAAALSFARTSAPLHQPGYGWHVPLWRALRALAAGEAGFAGEQLRKAIALGEQAGSITAYRMTTRARWMMAAELSDLETLAELAGELETLPGSGLEPTVMLALIRAQLGELDQARAMLDGIAPQLPGLPQNGDWLPIVCRVVELLQLVGPHPVAPWCLEAIKPYRQQVAIEGPGAGSHASTSRHAGILFAMLGETDRARKHFDYAWHACAGRNLPGAAARARFDAAVALADPALMREAEQEYRELGWQVPRHVPANVFRGEDQMWTLGYRGRTVRLREVKGLRDLAFLLAAPGVPVPATDLYGGGLTPVAGNPAERARTAVTARITDVLRKIDAAHPELAEHLRSSVTTGAQCCYSPDSPTSWVL
ncbi:hypothetical protein D5S17_33415 [Pseudonocardiaceae bacterium YIM PH 21723]|nr:hypothetical protein D5S17_33415 [Pseudonocardiaceae bacterium YIM PH 21723]